MSAFQVNGSPRAYIASSLRERTSTVHPHACGEHIVSSSTRTRSFGSSPRMWGTLKFQSESGCSRRFIPTHVGNTHARRRGRSRPTVHPHACGEHPDGYRLIRLEHGSSPRMWGTHHRGPLKQSMGRFIPTHVGNTAKTQARHCVPAVHPHACGEHWTSPYRSCRCGGSSPRMWGTPGAGAVGGSPRRFIPTHVGNTGASPAGAGRWSVHPHACGEHTYRTELFLKKKKHLEKSTASSSIPWSDPEAGMPPIAARRTTLDVDG
ncbi:hypothetical protein Q072_03228 [Pseudomonas aeruginosa BL18]|nr:hypothetical protein Q072_03228 [Pseudomonas aeruginosa BL18]